MLYRRSNQLTFDNPPEVIGKGSFGLVLLAGYHGTPLAVKNVLPSKASRPKRSPLDIGRSNRSTNASDSACESNPVEGKKGASFHCDKSDNKSGHSSSDGSDDLEATGRQSRSLGSKQMLKSMGMGSYWRQDKYRKAFIEEMRFISKLRHPCIITVS
jgi:serine/threonine protein kinase